jgi:O-antigen/teichoic acid export membrane protein
MMIGISSATLWLGAQIVLQMGAHFGINKLLAVSYGTVGVQAVLALFFGLCGVQAFAKGVTRLTAHHSQSHYGHKKIVSNAIVAVVFIWIIGAFGMVLFTHFLGSEIFGLQAKDYLIVAIGLFGVAASFQQIFVGWLTGQGLIPTVSISNAMQALMGLILVFLSIKFLSFDWAILGMVISQGLFGLGFLGYFCIQMRCQFDLSKEMLTTLMHYGAGVWLSIILGAIAMLVVRLKIEGLLGMHGLGIWQALVRVSDGYFAILSQMGHSYFFLRFVKALNNHQMLRREILISFVFGGVGIGVILCLVLIGGSAILDILYSSEFEVGAQYFPLMVINDMFKYCAMVLSLMLLSTCQTRVYILQDLIFNLILIAGCIANLFTDLAGVWYLMISAHAAIIFFMSTYVMRIVLKND